MKTKQIFLFLMAAALVVLPEERVFAQALKPSSGAKLIKEVRFIGQGSSKAALIPRQSNPIPKTSSVETPAGKVPVEPGSGMGHNDFSTNYRREPSIGFKPVNMIAEVKRAPVVASLPYNAPAPVSYGTVGERVPLERLNEKYSYSADFDKASVSAASAVMGLAYYPEAVIGRDFYLHKIFEGRGLRFVSDGINPSAFGPAGTKLFATAAELNGVENELAVRKALGTMIRGENTLFIAPSEIIGFLDSAVYSNFLTGLSGSSGSMPLILKKGHMPEGIMLEQYLDAAGNVDRELFEKNMRYADEFFNYFNLFHHPKRKLGGFESAAGEVKAFFDDLTKKGIACDFYAASKITLSRNKDMQHVIGIEYAVAHMVVVPEGMGAALAEVNTATYKKFMKKWNEVFIAEDRAFLWQRPKPEDIKRYKIRGTYKK